MYLLQEDVSHMYSTRTVMYNILQEVSHHHHHHLIVIIIVVVIIILIIYRE